jgi:hypothetical protein
MGLDRIMKIFTLWNQSPIPPAYQACIDSWGDSLQVIRGDSGDMRPMIWSDHERIRLLADPTFYPDQPVLYIDADCMKGPKFDEMIDSLPTDKPSFGTLRGGDYDIWACMRPVNTQPYFAWLYSQRDVYSGIGWYKHKIDQNRQCGRIEGYPDDRYIVHKNLSLVY